MSSTQNDIPQLSIDEFIRAIAVNRSTGHSLFLGAGASISSGIPAASSCIWEWKRRLFVTKNPRLSDLVTDTSLSAVQDRIQRWLDEQRIYPLRGESDEYGRYAEICFPIPEDRRRFFQELVQDATPHLGYRIACILAEEGFVNSIWTTNFDSLFIRAAADARITPIEIGLDTSSRIVRQPCKGEVLHVSLHGDYRYDWLKNTEEEIRNQDHALRAAFMQHLLSNNVLVIGYSGRDSSVMQILHESYSQAGTGRLYWCGFGDSTCPGEVADLLHTAKSGGRKVFYIPTSGFDDVLTRLADHCLSEPARSRARSIWSSSRDADNNAPFDLPVLQAVEIIKSNAFQLTLPVDVLEIDIKPTEGPGLWQRLREHIQGRPVVAAVYRGKFLAFGEMREVHSSLQTLSEGAVRRTPLQADECGNSAISGLIGEALVNALAASHGLGTDGRRLVWHTSMLRSVQGELRVHNAARLEVRTYANKLYIVLEPTVVVIGPEGEILHSDRARDIRRAILTSQYNEQFNQDVNTWRNLLFPELSTTINFPPEAESTFSFAVSSRPLFAGIAEPSKTHGKDLPENVAKFITQRGIHCTEPELAFCRRDRSLPVFDAHPMRGIALNRPLDYRLADLDRDSAVRIGVICPNSLSRAAEGFLRSLERKANPTSKLEYLLPYPGYSSAFAVTLEVPSPGEARWALCHDPLEPPSPEGSRNLARQIVALIERQISAASVDVVVVCIPTHWRPWEHYENEEEVFDLHDFVKAYCVQKGVPTQFLREATFSKPHQCEIRWWLALALYAKSMRTPWALKSLDASTAFMGLGFSVKPKGSQGGHVVLGCSHIYSAEGIGLRYRLSRIENAVIRDKSPFMSYDDARRVGESARQLLSERGGALPKRVVIHRRTQFLEQERQGLRDGLSGINSVEMLEITVEPSLRYIASKMRSGQTSGDMFPVQRGTAVLLDEHRFLLWAHGSVPALEAGKRYFKGKSRIPAPLAIRRHSGYSSIGTISSELLGLSKMDWNNFDMYSQLPATIESSNAIARIGALLQRFGASSYDYRLFM